MSTNGQGWSQAMSDGQDQSARAFEAWMKMWTQLPNMAPPGVREAMGAWQQMMQTSFDQMANNEVFLATMGKSMTASFEFKEQVDRTIERQLQAMGMPTQSDVVGLRKRLRQLDDRMEDLGEALETFKGGAPGAGAGADADTNAAAARLEAAAEAATRAAEAATLAAEAALRAAERVTEATEALKAAAAAQVTTTTTPAPAAPEAKTTSSKRARGKKGGEEG